MLIQSNDMLPLLAPASFILISRQEIPQCFFSQPLHARLSMAFVISASFWPVTSNLMSYVAGIGFQFIVASLSFFYFDSETGPLGS